MSWFVKAFVAIAFGVFTLIVLACVLLFFLELWLDIRNVRCKQVTRFLAGIAVCGLVGALVIQALGLWVT